MDYNSIVSNDLVKNRTRLMTLVGGALIVVGFFLPWLSMTIFFSHYSTTGLGLLIDSFKGEIEALPAVIPLLIAIYAIIAAVRKLNTKIYAIPSAMIIAYLLYELLAGILRGKGDFADFFTVFGIGLHMTWVGLLLLAIFGFLGYGSDETAGLEKPVQSSAITREYPRKAEPDQEVTPENGS